MTTDLLPTELSIEILPLKKGALVFRAVNNGLRQQILQLIHKKKTIIVKDIYTKLRIEQAVASQHLAILRKAGLVLTQRDGKFIHYSIHYKRLEELHHFAEQLLLLQ
jgi:DNA-binding transcriptional ArsR family regulator